MTATRLVNGLASPPATEKESSAASPPRVVLAGKTGRILCVADIRGDHHELNRLIREHEATAVIHTGDFGFINSESLDRMNDNVLRHLIQYSPLLPPATRQQLLAIPPSAPRADLIKALNDSSTHFPLSQFPHLLSGAITFPVPVFTVYGLIEDVRVMEKFRTGEYEVHNLTILDECSTRVIDVSGIKLRLFGLGGAVAFHKLFDSGDGRATIAGGEGTMWATALQIGELIDTAQRNFDSTETRLLICSAPVSRHGILAQLASVIKADLTISGGLHFRYPASFNDYSIHGDFDLYQNKFISARDTFSSVYSTVKDRIESSLTPEQIILLKKTLAATEYVPKAPQHEADDQHWTNQWHWVLSDASTGHLLLSITDARISMESKSQGINFAHRSANAPAPPSAPLPTQPQIPIQQPQRSAAEPHSFPKPGAMPPVRSEPVHGFEKPPINRTQPSMNTFRQPIPPRPLQMPNRPPTNPNGPVAPPAATSGVPAQINTNGPHPVPSRPAGQVPRNPRGPPGNLAGHALAAAGMSKPENKPTIKETESRQGPIAGRPALSPANGKITPAPAPAQTENRKPDGAINGREVARESEAKEGVNGEEARGTPADGEERTHSRKNSLFIKNLPQPVKDEDIRKSFGALADKITHVKVPYDHIRKNTRDFGYVDFATEEDAKAALESHTGKIGDKDVQVSISNPPARPPFDPRNSRGRGRGSFRGVSGMRGRGMTHGTAGSRDMTPKEGSGDKTSTTGGNVASGVKKEVSNGAVRKETPAATVKAD
ncbi:hypothetical protein M231_07779 [Tremella mesenterica]|uniref:RRM domain-containing protein n=1 Tax=Tremella mesenterica TaxID=5217 RepID=A0A4Q1BDM9_TREME|nr:hypothetical protein M231_07779 [Tremella mesenterica]